MPPATGRSVAEAAMLAGQFRPAGFLDDAYPQAWGFDNVSVLGRIEDMARNTSAARWAVVPIGNNDVRRRHLATLRALGIRLATTIHPQAVVSPSEEIGEDVTIMTGSIIGPESRIGCGVIVNCVAVVDQHRLEAAHIGMDVSIAGGTKIGESAWLRAGCSMGYRVNVSARAILSLGTVLGK